MTAIGLTRSTVLRLGVAQLLNWGATFYLLGAFGEAIGNDFGWSRPHVFAGLSLAMLLMGLVSPLSGTLIERFSGRSVMQTGAVLNTLGCIGLAACETSVGYFGAWLILGVGMRLSLYDAAFATLAGLAGARARPAMVQITLLGGLSSAVFWPLGHALLESLGWRQGVVIYAALALCSVALLAGVPKAPSTPSPETRPMLDQVMETGLGTRKVLYASSVMLISFMAAGLTAHLPSLLGGLGMPVGLVALWGIGQTSARLAETTFARTTSALRLNLRLGVGLPLCFLVALLSQGSVLLACTFVFGYGALNGLATSLRASLPFELFEHRQYTRLLGQLLAPSFILSASAPWLYAGVRDQYGDQAVLWLSLGISCAVLAVGLLLSRTDFLRPTYRLRE